ncbi:hypothetical protein VP1G_06390 [Cytospora mali]|uniref:Protein kinase domain-containing protein n=1 Tax=Cytospora mali TaxID=578113 RepID=A0A194V5G3_CYTMA|nr:hypothetical protein VP1G_06390 [Valsa mali var. pyri (nom. inval.)]
MELLPPDIPLPPGPPSRIYSPRPSNPRRRLLDLKRNLIDRFAFFRLGLQEYLNYDNEGRRRIRQFILIPPNPGPWPGHPRATPRQTIWAIRRPGVLARLFSRGEQDGGMRRAADRVGRTLRRDFQPARFRFRKRLGYGGFGAAFLFEMSDRDGYVLPVVVKAAISGRQRLRAMQKEEENFVIMAGAQHFVQRCVLQTFPDPARPTGALGTLRGLFSRLGVGGNAPDRNGDDDHDDVDNANNPADRVRAARSLLDHRRDIIIMEYMSRGNLQTLITRLQGRDKLSDRMLWLIFECLFKACIAMAHPLAFCPRDRNPWEDFVMLQDETAPRSGRLPEAPLVHFDIDPQNALIGDFGLPGEDHDSVPIVKIADPGLSEVVDGRFRRDEWKLWAQRACGKADFYTPEQFTPEWDYEASKGLYDLSREQTAGNYQWWTNLFQVGYVMFCLITQCSPPTPPVAKPYSYPAEDGSNDILTGYTYGMILYAGEYRSVDRRLRDLVVRCLDHNAMERPEMSYLELVIDANVGRMDLRGRESDEELTRNARRIFGEPP